MFQCFYLADGLRVGSEKCDRVRLHSQIPERQYPVSTPSTQNVRLDRVSRNAGQTNLEKMWKIK